MSKTYVALFVLFFSAAALTGLVTAQTKVVPNPITGAGLPNLAPHVTRNRPLDERRPLAEPGLIKALDRLTQTQGPDISTWRWGRMHTQSFDHPFIKAYNLPTIERSGASILIQLLRPVAYHPLSKTQVIMSERVLRMLAQYLPMKTNRLRVILRTEKIIGRDVADLLLAWIGRDAWRTPETR